MRAVLAAAAAAAIIAASSPSWAGAGVVVLKPDAGAKVTPAQASAVFGSISAALAHVSAARVEPRSAGAITGRPGLGCASDPSCIADAGKALGARRVVASLLLRDHGGKALRFVLVTVDVSTAAVVERDTHELDPRKLKKQPGGVVLNMLALLPPLPAEKAARAQLAAPPAAPAPAAPVASASPAAGLSHAGPARWQVGVAAGPLLARGDLGVGGVMSVELGYRLRRRLAVSVNVEAFRLADRGQQMLTPPSFPRSLGELAQTVTSVGALAGATYAFMDGRVQPYVGLGVGAFVTNSRFDAYGREVDRQAAAPGAIVRGGAKIAIGPGVVVAELSDRELIGSFDAPSHVGDSTVAGAALTAGYGMSF